MLKLYTNKIVVHHAVMPQDWPQAKAMSAILSAHRSAGLAYDGRIAYHWVIGDGWTAQGRPDNTVGYHAGNWLVNLSSVAICLMGNFNDNKLTPYQTKWLTEKLWDYMADYNLNRSAIKLHRNISATACPGRNIDLPLIYDLLDDTGDLGSRITDEFIKVWKRIPAHGEYEYFKRRIEKGSVDNLHELREVLWKWYDIVYPNKRYSKEGDALWQKEKVR
jgi:hypothetical protein